MGLKALTQVLGSGSGGVSSINGQTGTPSITSTGGTITITTPGGNINLEASGGASVAFTAITSGTNAAAAMVVGTGSSLAASGSGSITATAMPASGLTGTTLPAGIVTSSLTTVGTIGTGVWNAGAVTSSGAVQGTTLVSTVATGTAPLTVTSTTQVANLNAATAGSATTATTATNATNTAITDDTTTNATMNLTWVTTNTGNLPQKVTSTKLNFNPSTGVLSSTSFTGAGTGLTGTAASLTAGTASAVAVGGITGLGTGVATALAVNVGTAGSPVVNGGALGTPSSGTGTNITGIPAANILAGTFGSGPYSFGTGNAVTLGTIELGNASDTTLSRSSAGVMAVEGVVIPSISSTNTLTNKRVTRRTSIVTQSATPAINSDNMDIAQITGLAQAITSMTTSLTGTPSDCDLLEIQITDNGTAQAITWGTSFANGGTINLPLTTVISTMLRVLVEYQTTASLNKWVCVATA